MNPGDNRGIELVIEQLDDLKDHFQTLPNALLRGDRDEKYGFDFRDYTLRERALLGALVGMQSGHRCSRARIDMIAGRDLGPDAVDTIIKGLKRRGHLRTTRVNDPDRSGKFVWRWQVSLRPTLVAVDDIDETAGQPMGGPSTHGPSTDGPSMDGSAIGGQSGSKYVEEPGVRRTRGSRTTTTPRRRTAAVEAVEDAPPAEKTQGELVDAALAAAPHWSRTKLLEVLDHPDMRDRITRAPAATAAALLAVASGRYGYTRSPRRVLEDGDWWGEAHGTAPAPVASPPPAPPQRCPGGCMRGMILVEQVVDGHRTGRDRPQPCPHCRGSAVA